jgi:hypothetical protein
VSTFQLLRELRASLALLREAVVDSNERSVVLAAIDDLDQQVGRAQAAEVARHTRRRQQPHVCSLCGIGFDFPGELEEHRRRVHGGEGVGQ